MSRVRPVVCPILVGRDDLLDLADRRIAEVAQGRGRTLFLAGQAGLGKTRLVRATARKGEAAGLRVDGGSVAPQDRHVPLASIRDMATGMRGNKDFGSLSADLLAIDGRHDGDALGARRLIVRSVADRILEAIDRPTMLVFDDLHWTDELSLEVIAELARHLADRPLFLLGGYRADEFPAESIHREWRARLLSQRHAEEVRLRPLTLEETAVVITLILGGELPAPRDVVEAIHARTNGIPLHVEELLAALDDDARTDGRRIREAHVPDTIGDAVLARLARLSADARTVARAGAVVGRCFRPDVIAGMVDRPLSELEQTLEELVDAAIIYPFDYVDRGYYDFRHQLLRDAVYGSVPPSQLRRFHAQAAEFVMTLESSSIVHASRHYERAGLRPQAFRAAVSGARSAAALSSHREAFELYGRAVDNMPADLGMAEQGELFEAYSGEAGAIEEHDISESAARTARERYLQAGRPLEAARSLINVATVGRREGRPVANGLQLATQGLLELDALEPTPDRESVRSVLLVVRCALLLDSMDLDGAREAGKASMEAAAVADDPEGVLEAEARLGQIMVLSGEVEAGLAQISRAAHDARQAGYESVGVSAYRDAASMSVRVMEYRGAEMALMEGMRYADAIQQSHCRHVMGATSALVAWVYGRWDDAIGVGGQELVEHGCSRGAIGAEVALGYVAMGRGEIDKARALLRSARASGELGGTVELILPAIWGLAETEVIADQPGVALELCTEAFELAMRTGERALFAPFAVTGARAMIAAGRPEAADRWTAEVAEFLEPWVSIVRPAIDHANGLVKLASGSTGLAREALSAAVAGWDDRSRVWESTWARLDLASCLLRSSRYADAAVILATAQVAATRLDSAPLAARVAELTHIANRHGSFDEPWRPLTSREFEVARLIADGRTNAEIAGELSIAPKTASAHVEHILAKLGVARRAEVATWVATVARVGITPSSQSTVGASR